MTKTPMLTTILAAAVMLAGAGPACAGILIESDSASGGARTVMIDDDKARIDTDGEDRYMLLDLESQKVLVVNGREHFAMDVTSPLPRLSRHAELATAGAKRPEVRLERVGAGPFLVGFPTTHYRVMVNDAHCRDEFLATEPLDAPGIRRFIATLAAASNNEQRMMLMLLTDEGRACEAAEDLVDDHYAKLGMPMRAVGLDGQILHQITRIRFDATSSPDALTLPPNTPVLTRTQVSERIDGASGRQTPQPRRHTIEELQQEIGPQANGDQP